jgi:hypothetical protein
MSTNAYQQALLNKSRSDKFILTVRLPKILRNIDTKSEVSNTKVNLDSLQFSLFNCTIPAEVIPQVDIRYAGGNVYLSSHNKPSYEPMTINFTVDNEFKNYWVIHKWLQVMRNEQSSIYSGEILPKDAGLGQYSADFIMTALDEFEQPIIQWMFKDGFPVSIGELVYNYRDAKELETSFQFVFDRIETNLITS